MADAYDFYNVNFISADGSIKSIAVLTHDLRKMNFFRALIDEGKEQPKRLFIEVEANNITILCNEYFKYDSFLLILNFLVRGRNFECMNNSYALLTFKEAANLYQAEGALAVFINQEKNNISVAQFINANYPAQLIYDAYKEQLNVESLITEFLKYPCYSASLISRLGYTAKQLQRNNICLDAVVQANCFSHEEVISAYGASSAVAFINAGISINALSQYGHQGYGLKDTQYSVIELKEIGFNAKKLITAGFTAAELKAAHFTAKELREVGVADFELKAVHFTAVELEAAGLSARQLRKLGFTAEQLKAADFNAEQLITASFNTKDLIDIGFNVSQLTTAYLSYFKNNELDHTSIVKMRVYDRPGVRLIDDTKQRKQYYGGLVSRELLKHCGLGNKGILYREDYFKAEIVHRTSSFSSYRKSIYYDAREIMAICFKNNGVSAKELKDAGFSVTHLKVAEFTLNEIITAGYTLKEIRQSHQYSDAKINKEANTISAQSHQPELTSQLREMRHANDCCSAM